MGAPREHHGRQLGRQLKGYGSGRGAEWIPNRSIIENPVSLSLWLLGESGPLALHTKVLGPFIETDPARAHAHTHQMGHNIHHESHHNSNKTMLVFPVTSGTEPSWPSRTALELYVGATSA